MRTLTAQEWTTLRTRTRVTHLRVRVRRPDGTDVNLGALLGGDWLLGATWNESVATPVAQATVSVRRNGPGGAVQSLSPLVGNSLANRTSAGIFVPLLQEGRELRIDVATTLPGTVPAWGDWRESFYGRIDTVDVGPEEVRIDGRDFFGGHAQDTFIEAEANYGNDTVGVAVQTVMQQIGTAAGLNGYLVSNLWTPVDPLWQLGRFTQKRVPVYEAWQQLAGQLGWEVRQVWRDGVGFVPTLRSPERLAASPVWTFSPDDYLELPVVRRSLSEIRNVVEVVYSDYSDRDSTNQPKRKTVTSTNPSSVAEYGRRYMQVTEASNSNINSTAEAQRLADAAIADLSDSALEVEVSLRASFWPLQVGDMVTLMPDGVSLDSAQTLAVISIDHAFTSDGLEKTTLKLRGRPAISRDTWMARDAAPGVAPLSLLSGPDAPASLAVTNTTAGAVITFQPAPSGPEWATYELHLSTTSGFTPSSATMKATQATTRFEVAGLSPGVTTYAVVRGRTAEGNVGPASAQVTLLPRYLETRLLSPSVDFSGQPSNRSFEELSVPGSPPDNWVMTSGTWGVDGFEETVKVHSGARSVKLVGSVFPAIASQRFLAGEGDKIAAEVRYECKDSTTGDPCINLYIDYYGNTGTTPFLSVRVARGFGTNAIPEIFGGRIFGTVTVPGFTRYARLRIEKATSLPWTLYVDSARVVVSPP